MSRRMHSTKAREENPEDDDRRTLTLDEAAALLDCYSDGAASPPVNVLAVKTVPSNPRGPNRDRNSVDGQRSY